MDSSSVNAQSLSAENPSPYNFAEIYAFHGGSSNDVVDCKNLKPEAEFSEATLSRDFTVGESTVTERSRSIKKRRDAINENESSLLVSDASANASFFVGKRTRIPGHWDENNTCSQGEVEGNYMVKAQSSIEAKASELAKQDYIHVRARRGQATDSHSLAERARREKISDRMKLLQGLVPGCNKVIGKALVLDEIINYIQSLQSQVEFLSLKLETVNSTMGVLPSNDIGLEKYDGSAVLHSLPSTSEYNHGPELEWLHMPGR